MWCLLFKACTNKQQLLQQWNPVRLYINSTNLCSLKQLSAASPVSCTSVAPPASWGGNWKESRSRFLLELERAGGGIGGEKKGCGGEKSSAKKEMEGECEYGEGEEVEEGWIAG